MAGVGTVAGGAADVAAQDAGGVASTQAVRMLSAIREEIATLRAQMASSQMPTSSGIEKIRQQQRQFLKGNAKFPDYVEVGAGIWDELVDWHVRTLRPLNITLRTDGRYTMPFLQSMIILRADYGDDQVGVAFDTRPA
jgi:hypothetical protein